MLKRSLGNVLEVWRAVSHERAQRMSAVESSTSISHTDDTYGRLALPPLLDGADVLEPREGQCAHNTSIVKLEELTPSSATMERANVAEAVESSKTAGEGRPETNRVAAEWEGVAITCSTYEPSYI